MLNDYGKYLCDLIPDTVLQLQFDSISPMEIIQRNKIISLAISLAARIVAICWISISPLSLLTHSAFLSLCLSSILSLLAHLTFLNLSLSLLSHTSLSPPFLSLSPSLSLLRTELVRATFSGLALLGDGPVALALVVRWSARLKLEEEAAMETGADSGAGRSGRKVWQGL